MTDRFGPGQPCSECGGDYGAHTDTCPMATPHAPEGGPEPTRDEVWESLSPEDRAAIERGTKAYYERWAAGRFPSYEEAAADDEGQEILIDFYRDLIGRPIAMRREEKLRADGATAERARLAGMASEEDREMETENIAAAQLREAIFVAQGEGYCPTSDWVTWLMDRLTGYRARLAAARGERDEAIRQLGVALGRIAAADRAGAERALRWAWRNEGAVCTEPEDELLRLALATLFPPPGAEVGRG